FFFFSSRRRHTRFSRDWSSDVCSSDLKTLDRVFPELPVICGRRNAISTTMGIKYCVVAEITGHIGKREIYLVPINEAQAFEPDKIGRASCRERGYVEEVAAAVTIETEG